MDSEVKSILHFFLYSIKSKVDNIFHVDDDDDDDEDKVFISFSFHRMFLSLSTSLYIIIYMIPE